MSAPEISATLEQFALDNDIQGLTTSTLQSIHNGESGYDLAKAKAFLQFQRRIDTELLQHSIIVNNDYTEWFSTGQFSKEQLKDFVVQFSVFSNLFLIAQLKKMINADSLEAMRASKEILANELGVVFNPGAGKRTTSEEADPNLVSEVGTVEGGIFHFKAGHFEWLLRVGDALGLSFNDMGKRRHGIETTLFFCDELSRLYGSEDYATSQAASYAVENWAAAGFWDQLVSGFKSFNEMQSLAIPLGFFSWHSRLEAQHAEHTQEELEEYYFEHSIDEDAFIQHGNEMLVGVERFWLGLNDQRSAAE